MHPSPSTASALPAAQRLAAHGATATAHTRWVDVDGRHLVLRPLLPQDAASLGLLFNQGLTAHTRRQRFHAACGAFTPARLALMTQLDPARERSLVVAHVTPTGQQLLAEGRWARHPVFHPQGHRSAELALSVADAWQGLGLGRRLLAALTACAPPGGVRQLTARVLPGNPGMQGLLVQAGFTALSRAQARREGGDASAHGHDTDDTGDSDDTCLHYQLDVSPAAGLAAAPADAEAARHAGLRRKAVAAAPGGYDGAPRGRTWTASLSHVLWASWHRKGQP